MWFRKRKKEFAPPPELVLSSAEGKVWMTFPVGVVDSLRRIIIRLGRKEIIPERISVVAALRQEGVTYIARALAATMAHDLEATVCLVDMNWWWPSPLPDPQIETGGLGAVLTGDVSLEKAVVTTGRPNLAILPAGNLPLMERFAYAQGIKLKEVINELAARYDHLVFDVPALLAVNEAVPLASLGTTVCLVVHHGATYIEEVRAALDDIDHLTIAGVILNKANVKAPPIISKFVSRF